MAVIVPILAKLDPKGFNDAKKSFGSLSGSIKKSLAGIGVGLGLAALTNQLKAAGKAAAQDAKSQGLLALALRNTVGATNEQIAAVETQITKFQNLSAIADDNIRPAFSRLVVATGDITTATGLMSLALDVSAGTGKDLSAVSSALAKAHGGQATALNKLVPGIANVTDKMAFLQETYGGAAEAAADLDPYQRLSLIFGDLQEQIGMALLPYLNQFADWLSSPLGQEQLKLIARAFAEIVTSVASMVTWLGNNRWIVQTIAGLAAMAKAWVVIFNITKAIYGAQKAIALTQFVIKGAESAKGWAAIAAAAAALAAGIGTFVALDAMIGGISSNIKNIEETTTDLTVPEIPGLDPATKGTKALTAAQKAAAESKKKLAAETKALAEALAKEQEALANLVKELQGLTGAVQPLIKLGREIGEFEQAAVDSFDAIAESIEQGVANKTIIARAGKNLLDYVATERKALTAIAQQRDELASKRGLAEALIGDVKAAVVGFATITDLVNKETGNLTSNFADVVSKTKAFASQLKQLRELGLDKNLYKQIVDAGIDAGGATAAEIIAGGAGTVTELNNLFSELERAGAAIAEDTALVMYNNGVEVAGGLVAGLMSQEQALVEAAQTLADAFTSTFNSMITNLKVPSQEVEQITLSIADIAKGNTGLAGANSNISRSLASNYLRRTGGEGAQTITINVRAGLGTDGKAVGQAIQAELNKYNRSNVALV
jgi:plasmid maintenance system antidote protein VapI